MTYGTSLLLIAVGAILRWAVTAHVKGFSIHTVGVILLVVGIVGLVLSLLLTLGLFSRRGDTVVRERHYDPPAV
jgi:Domain of unknown function (DUF6458)